MGASVKCQQKIKIKYSELARMVLLIKRTNLRVLCLLKSMEEGECEWGGDDKVPLVKIELRSW